MTKLEAIILKVNEMIKDLKKCKNIIALKIIFDMYIVTINMILTMPKNNNLIDGGIIESNSNETATVNKRTD